MAFTQHEMFSSIIFDILYQIAIDFKQNIGSVEDYANQVETVRSMVL